MRRVIKHSVETLRRLVTSPAGSAEPPLFCCTASGVAFPLRFAMPWEGKMYFGDFSSIEMEVLWLSVALGIV